MISSVELRRILGEWRLRVQRVKDILQPPTWNEQEWRQFSQALALMVRDHGRSWIIEPNVYWDLRWRLQDGAELICQIEHIPGEKTSLVVAQNGGFAAEVGSYTWLWAEFNMEGNFSRDPYWVEGTWKEALTSLLLPLDRQASYLLAGRTETPDSLLLQEGARPNDNHHRALLPGLNEASGNERVAEPREKRVSEVVKESTTETSKETVETKPVENVTKTETAPTVEAKEEKPVETPVAAADHIAPPTEPKHDIPISLAETIPTVPKAPFAIQWGTVYRLMWKDTDDIAYALIEKFPQQDPTLLTQSQIHDLVIALHGFADDPQHSNPKILEAIQMAWYEEVG